MTNDTRCTPRGLQHHRQQRQQRQRTADLAQHVATLAAYLAQDLAAEARRTPTARTARLAIDALQIATNLHSLAADVWDTLEEVAA